MAARALAESHLAESRDGASPRGDGGAAPRRAPLRIVSDPVSIEPDEFRAELACGSEASPGPDPYEEGFGAYASGAGLVENPYHVDNSAHQQWAHGWSQARDQARRQSR